MTAREYIEKAVASTLQLSEAQIEDIFQNPKNYAFDVEAEKFYKPAETHIKIVIGVDGLNVALNDGFTFDKILNFGELPTKIQVRKRIYLEPESFAEKKDELKHSLPRRPFD